MPAPAATAPLKGSYLPAQIFPPSFSSSALDRKPLLWAATGRQLAGEPARCGAPQPQRLPGLSVGEGLLQRKPVAHQLPSLCVSGAGSPGLLLAWSPGPRRAQRAPCRSPDPGSGAGGNLPPDVRAGRDWPEPRNRPLQHASAEGPEGRGNQGEQLSRADPAQVSGVPGGGRARPALLRASGWRTGMPAQGGNAGLRCPRLPFCSPLARRPTGTTCCVLRRWRASSTCTGSLAIRSTRIGVGRSYRVSINTPG